MGHQITAHWPDRKSKTGFREERPIAWIAESMWSGGIHELYTGLECESMDAGVSGTCESRRVPRKVIDAALKRYCQELMDGEEVAAEVAFLAGCVAGWLGKDKSIHVWFG